MNASWQRGFDAAKAISQYGSAPRVARRVGAALYSGGRLLSVGYNSYGHSHPDTKWGIHAEHRALIRRQYRDTERHLIMYIWRQLADGTPANSEPCPNCIRLMQEAGVETIRYWDAHAHARTRDIK